MLPEFLDAHRGELLARCEAKIAQRTVPEPGRAALEEGVQLFLEQLIGTLRVGLASDHGYRAEQVVRDYGALCEAITDLAFERAVPVGVEELRILNRCLNHAIADAVTESSRRRDALRDEIGARTLSERLGSVAHELRNHVHTATLALAALKAGGTGLGGAAGGVLDEVRKAAALEAQARGCELSVAPVERHLAVRADRELLLGALANLLQNALKFTAPRTRVSMTGFAAGGRILIEVADHCGGLPAGRAQRLFVPFVQATAPA